MAKEAYHVVKNPRGGWSVRRRGSSRASGVYKTQKDAVVAANKISKKQGTKTIIHGPNGLVMKL